MKKTISKIIVLMLTFLLSIILMQLGVYASNENVKIVETNEGDYLIYIKKNLDKDFEFAFSNDKNADKETLTYTSAETDTESTNKIAYVNSSTESLFTQPTYMWARVGEEYIVEGVQIDLNDSINEFYLELASELTKTIKVEIGQTETQTTEKDGKEVSVTLGKVILKDKKDNLDYSYMYSKLPSTENYNKFADLAKIISKFNSETDEYTKIDTYNQFIELFFELIPGDEENWVEVEENEIPQPTTAEDGEQYILWIMESENGDPLNIDVQFLTAHKEYSEKTIKEAITTKLPVTYDNNTLLIVLGILIIAELVVFVRIKALKNKQEK